MGRATALAFALLGLLSLCLVDAELPAAPAVSLPVPDAAGSENNGETQRAGAAADLELASADVGTLSSKDQAITLEIPNESGAAEAVAHEHAGQQEHGQPQQQPPVVPGQQVVNEQVAAQAPDPRQMNFDAERRLREAMHSEEMQKRLRDIETRFERERAERGEQRGSIWSQMFSRLFGFGGSNNNNNNRNTRGQVAAHEAAGQSRTGQRPGQGVPGMPARAMNGMPMGHRGGAAMGSSGEASADTFTRRGSNSRATDAQSFFFAPVLVAMVLAYFIYTCVKLTSGKKHGKNKRSKRRVFGFGRRRRTYSSSDDSDDSDSEFLGAASATGVLNPVLLSALGAMSQKRPAAAPAAAAATAAAESPKQPPAAQPEANPAPTTSANTTSGTDNGGAPALVAKDVRNMSLDELVALQRMLLEETVKRQQLQATVSQETAASNEQKSMPDADECGLRKRNIPADAKVAAESDSMHT